MSEEEPFRILDLPFEERLVILVARSNEDWLAQTFSRGMDWKWLAGVAGASLLAPVSFPVLAAGLFVGSSTYVVRKHNEFSDAGFFLATKDMLTEMSFTPGHPRPTWAYAGHPYRPSVYIPVANYHEAIVQEKARELLNLLAGLGAKKTTVQWAEGYKLGGRVSGAGTRTADEPKQEAPATGSRNSEGPETATSEPASNQGAVDDNKEKPSPEEKRSPKANSSSKVSFSTGAKNKVRTKVKVVEEYTNQNRAEVPEGLLWFDHDKDWQELANRRRSGPRFSDQLLRSDR